jgi:hypothetical protein
MADLENLLDPEPEPPDPRDNSVPLGVLCVGPKKTTEELQDAYAPNWRTGDWRTPWALGLLPSTIEFEEPEV